MEKEAQALVDAGWNVSVVLPHARNENRHGVRLLGVRPPSSRFVRATYTAVKVALKGLKERADVYHFHDPELIPVGLLLRALGKKVIYDVHETYSYSIAHREAIPHALRKPLSWLVSSLERVAARCFSGIVAATPAIEQQFTSIGTPRVVVQNFPRLNGRVPVPASDTLAPHALYMGAMSDARGVLTMIEAVSRLPASLNARLTLAGSIDAELLARMKSVPGFNRVTITGLLSRQQLTTVINNATVGLVLFHPLPNHVESFPTKMFEYMEAGLPVLASDFPLWRSIVLANKCGIVVNPLDVSEIATSLQYLMSNQVEARKMGERGRALVQGQYNWLSESEKLVSFYNRVTAAESAYGKSR